MDKKESQYLRKIKELEDKVEYYNNLQGAYSILKNIPLLPTSLSLARKLKSKAKKTGIAYKVSSKSPEIIAICHPEFRGVRSATYALVKDVIEIPELYYKSEVKRIAKEVAKFNPKKILISGYPVGYDLLIIELKKILPESRILFLSHASFTWYGTNIEEAKNFSKVLALAKEGIVEKVGFVKKDNTEFFKEKGFNTFFVMNRFSIEEKKQKALNLKKPNIGVTGSNMWHRNLLNQVVAGLMVRNSIVHVNELNTYEFLDENRIVRHGVLSKNDFNELLKTIDVNLYVSFTDCFPMLVIESMTLGIPCLVSDTSEVYAWSEKLKEALVVSKIDSPIEISNQIKEVMSNYSEIQKEIKKYLPVLKEKVEKSISNFLT